MKNCIAAWATSCSKDCATAKCVSTCTTQAHDQCARNVAAPQHVFNGPVASTPVTDPQVCSAAPAEVSCHRLSVDQLDTGSAISVTGAACSVVTGTVANKAFWGGGITMYVICPNQSQFSASTAVIGRACSSPTDGSFSIVATNDCAGQTGCYGVIAVTPVGENNQCGGDVIQAPTNGDPGWATCTSGPCPDI
ncbi:MAG: hypothetical protein ABR567_12915 [Myxococcales bacterium]